MSDTADTRVQPKNVVYATLSGASAVLLLGLLVLVKHALGLNAFGGFNFALSLATIGEGLMDFGIHQITIRSIARDRSSATRIFQNTLALKVVPGVVMFAALSVVAFVFASDADLRLACVLMLVSAVLRSYLLTIRGVLLGLERFRDESMVVIGDRVLVFAAVAVALERGDGLVGVALAFVVARVLAVGAGFALTHRRVGPPMPAYEPDLWRELQRSALPLGAFLIVLNVYNYIDTILLTILRPLSDTGLYNAAYRTYEGLTYVPAVFSSLLTPRLSHLWSVDRAGHGRLLRRGLASAIALAAGIGAVTWFVAPWVLATVFGADTLPAVPTLRILAAGLAFVFAIWILHAAAISVFEQRLLLQTTIVGVVANTALNLWLVPRFGPEGAAWATVAGEALTLALLTIGLWSVLSGGAPADSTPSDDTEFGNLDANLRFLEETGVLRPGAKVLEIGSGRGTMLATLRKRGVDVQGVETSADRIREAAAHYGALPLQLATSGRLPFADAAFDVVMSFDVFEHIAASDEHLADVRRVLKPGGVYVLQTPNKWTNSVFETIRWRSFTRWKGDHCALHSYSELDRRFRANALTPQFYDIPVVTPFFREKVRRYVGPVGLAALAILQPDRWPRRFRTNFYVKATR